MSDGTTNFPERLTHPDTPIPGRVKTYIFNDGGGTKEPYYKLDDGSENTLKGDQGDQGIQGIQGDPGNDGSDGATGPAGPAGPVSVDYKNSRTATVTLPNSTTFQTVYSDNLSAAAAGEYILSVSISAKCHSPSNDIRFQLDFDSGTILLPVYTEEHKDSSNDQSAWRTYNMDMGNLAAGSYPLDLQFSKEATGGSAQIKGYTVILWRHA